MKEVTNCTRPRYVCGNEKVKLIGTIDGYFPDFGHHLENEMGGLWLYPVKLLDGFWMHFMDHTSQTAACYMSADSFENYPHKNIFHYRSGLGHTAVAAKRIQMAPEALKGIIVKYIFKNRGQEAVSCTVEFTVRVNLRPVWLSEEVQIFDGAKDEMAYRKEDTCFVAKDPDNPWFAVLGCSTKWDDCKIGEHFGPEYTKGNGISCVLEHHFQMEPGEEYELVYYFAGSEFSEEDAMNQYRQLRQDRDYEGEKENRYREILDRSNLHVEDERFNKIYNWTKVNMDWLILDQEKCGRGIVAGLPEYPWWFGCDSCYALQGILAIGDAGLCRDTLELIRNFSEKINGNGRIVHEILPNGHCPNRGNTQETAHFVTMVWKYYEWTGDRDMLWRCLPYIRKSITWLQTQDEDEDLYPSGYGIIEIAGLNMEMIDTAVYTCEAYECYAKMLELAGESEEASGYFSLYNKMKEKINLDFWDDEIGLYCDAYTSYQAVNEKRHMIDSMLRDSRCDEIRDYIKNLLKEREADGDRERGWLLNANWIINVPMETGIAEEDKALEALAKMKDERFIGEYGMYLDGLLQNSIMTISTGVMAVAQAAYGMADEALRLLEKMFQSYGMATPGAMSEMSPDYGCFVQAWTAYGVFVPVVKFFFGIQPSASEGKIVISPCLPSKWESAKLDNVKVLDGSISVSVKQKNCSVAYEVQNDTSYPAVAELRKEYKAQAGQELVCRPGERITFAYSIITV